MLLAPILMRTLSWRGVVGALALSSLAVSSGCAPAGGTAGTRAATVAPAAEPIDAALNARIREEGFRRSRVMETAIVLSDVHGPRLAGSPQFRRAAEWAAKELASYGLANAGLEPWGRRRGVSWTVERHSVEMLAPYYARIVAYPRAWSPSTDGVIRGTPRLVSIRADSDLVRYAGRLRGAILLNGATQRDTQRFEPLGHRFTDRELDSLAALTDPGEPRTYWSDVEGYAENVARRQRLYLRLREEGVAAVLEPSRNPNAVQVASYQAYDGDVSGAVPAFIVARADYDRLLHLVQRDAPVQLEVTLRARVAPDDSTGYNVVAELPGSDPAVRDEVVMVGGHFDSWTAGTGATDNAAGSAVAMEALRILAATGARPRRTIRIGLWDGEEHEEYFGSRGYVMKHFGDPETMTLKPAHATISAYFNFDNGTGRIRGLYAQGNAAARPILAAYLAPFADLGAATTTIKNVGSTDHMPFTALGIPAFTFIQDPIEYETRTHHTHLDVASRLLEEDLKQAAVVTASVIYHVANRGEKLPRPPLPPPHRVTTGAR